MEVRIPPAALLVSLEGQDGVEFDHDYRTLRWQGSIAGGTPREIMLTHVAGVDAGGQTASLHVTLRRWQGEPTYLGHSAEIISTPTPSMVRLGRVGVTAAGVAVFGWLVSAVLLWVVLRFVRPQAATWAPIAIMLPLGFLLYFAALARDDLRILQLPESTCTVLDRVIDSRTASSSTRSRGFGQDTAYAPRLALQYRQGAETLVAQGFGTESALPRRAYVERGFGGAYFFALIPLPLLLLGVWGLRRRW